MGCSLSKACFDNTVFRLGGVLSCDRFFGLEHMRRATGQRLKNIENRSLPRLNQERLKGLEKEHVNLLGSSKKTFHQTAMDKGSTTLKATSVRFHFTVISAE
eukprot:5689250-Amphidinium_carterae.1